MNYRILRLMENEGWMRMKNICKGVGIKDKYGRFNLMYTNIYRLLNSNLLMRKNKRYMLTWIGRVYISGFRDRVEGLKR